MKTLVLGIGNLLWADEGFGVRCVERFNQKYQCDDSVLLMDGGTQGIYLVHHVQECEQLLVFDAIDYGLTPGEIKIIEGDNVPRFMGAKKVSLHQTGFQEVISTAQLMGWEPKAIVLIGVQPAWIEDFGGSLTPEVKPQLEVCVDLGADILRQWQVDVTLRPVDEQGLLPSELDISRYESERPDESVACRVGDERILVSDAYDIHPVAVQECCRAVPIDGRLLFTDRD